MADPVYITALYADADAASRILLSLGSSGVQSDDVCVAMKAHDELLDFCSKNGTVPFESDIARQLQEAGITVERAAHCERRVQAGDVLLLLKAPEQADEIMRVLQESGGNVDIEAGRETVRIPLHAEQLRIRKRSVPDGEVRVRKVVTRSIVQIDVPFEREELVITRTPLSGEPETWRVPLRHEEITVQKRPVATNEVTLRRETTEDVQHLREPVLHEQLQVHTHDSSAGDQLTVFDATSRGNSSLSEDQGTENNMDLQEPTNSIHAFFPDRISAESAAEELRSQGIPDDAIRVQNASGGFLDGVKRFFSGEELDDGQSGATVLIVESVREQVEPAIEHFGGRIGHPGTVRTSEEGGTMKLHEERLNVHKEEAKQGEVRLTKEVISEQKEVDVPVKREEVVLNRRRINQPDEGAQINADEEIRIPVMREDVSVEKTPILTEEVGVEKRETERTEHVSATVQKERARLETEGRVGTTLKDVD